jgi:hypothetical protein
LHKQRKSPGFCLLLTLAAVCRKRGTGAPKWRLRVAVVNGIADSLNDNPNIQMAMRVYGHQSPQPLNDCEDSKLEIGFPNKKCD